jgi:RND superfamily putative drug exporter
MIGAPVTALVFDEGPLAGLRLPIDGEVSLGRANSEVGAADPELSRHHAILRPVPGGIEVEDLGSTNGTWVEGLRIVAPTVLAPGATLMAGQSRAHVEGVAPDGAEAAAGTQPRPAPGAATQLRPVPGAETTATQISLPTIPRGAELPGPPRHGRLARTVVGPRRKWWVLAIWLVLAVVVGGALGGQLPKLTNAQTQSDDALPSGAQSAQVGRLLRTQFPGGQRFNTLLVYERASGLTAADKARIAADARAVATVPDTAPAQVPYTPGAPPLLVSSNGKVAITVIPLSTDTSNLRDDAVKAIRARVGTGSGGLRIQLTGPAAIQSDFNTAVAGADVGLLAATVLLVLVLLMIIYRSPIAALIPLFVVGVAYAVAQGLVYVYAKATHTIVDRTALTLLAVLMFGAGTDYCLLLVSRYTADLREVADPHEAVAGALSRTEHAILASGCTVAAAMLTFLLSSLKTDHILAPVNAIGILTVMVAGVTLLPALLAIAGRRGFWPNGKAVALHEKPSQTGVRDSASALGETPGLWFRIAQRVTRRPVVALVSTLLVFAVGAAAGLVVFHEKISVTNDFRVQNDSTRGLALLRDGYPAGAIFPETVLLRRADGRVSAADVALAQARLRAIPGVADVSGVTETSRDGGAVTLTLVYSGDPFTDAALDRAQRLRDTVADLGPGLSGLVGEGTSARLDYKNAVNHDTKIIVPAVLLVIFITLVLLLRALVAPVYLLVTVVISYLGSLGFSVFIIHEVFGQQVDPFYPLITFVFLVALGVDYNIFLMSRVREEAIVHGTRDGLLRALVATGPVITSAGIILAGTFAALATLPLWVLLEIGFTVALGVLLDTFVVRTVMVPSLVRLFGERSWWPSSARAGADLPLISDAYRPSLIEQWRAAEPAGPG